MCADFFAGWRLTPYPAYGPCGLPLIYSPFLLARARGTGGGGDWPPPVRSLRHGKHSEKKLTGSASYAEATDNIKDFPGRNRCKPIAVSMAKGSANRAPAIYFSLSRREISLLTRHQGQNGI